MVDINVFGGSELLHLAIAFGAFLACVIAAVYFGLRYLGSSK